ncbi:bifunctional phosphoribosylanthranilate isomerase/tryptophan synthase subunit beta [Salisediminibacterium selenitireducens]|uniref:Multifunctional fusion protein n=1 Tax=Bacillus selenitireducens (strain ATCC 700615 / DSM 15326 / MLS10) TaxID=439292 RepID=D6XUZ1_BACIE|nr:bifunctional phosphoribosylanthranilate isomerase/tryptophan synthase subunit beta [Salisediminibacterium selenitireducens]ADH99627.1 tryptophan synthase, beta subunit [[Bacillus] selenitireducens MLS10]
MTIALKFCGITSEEDYQKAVRYEPDYIGFIFAESKRRVPPHDVRKWVDAVPPGRTKLAGVFVNASADVMIRDAEASGIDIVQAHGTEEVAELLKVKERTNAMIYKTIHHHGNGVSVMNAYQNVADGFVIDTKTPEGWGGTGTSFDWKAVPAYVQEANRQGKPCLIAGGVTPDNMQTLIDHGAEGIDVSSGTETDGVKDERKLKQMTETAKQLYQAPDSFGRYGEFGGKYVPETLMYALEELEKAFLEVKEDQAFIDDLNKELQRFSGRPTALTHAPRLTEAYGGAQIYLKREDLNHTGAHKINNALAQGLLAKRMGKTEIIAETGAGQHGVATATMAARFGMKCKVFMGAEDIRRQELNVFRMKLLGAEVIEVTSGGSTLKDATNEAIRHWVAHVDDTFYVIGSVVGPHPYPMMVRDFQRVIGDESKEQMMSETGRLPDEIVACVGGGSNAMGMFYPFLNDGVKMTGVEAAGKGLATKEHAATLSKGRKGVLHGSLSYLIQDDNGNIIEPYSISAGLDYPGIGPEHAHLRDTKRVNYVPVTDDEALDALKDLAELEGILPAIETAHALAYVKQTAGLMTKDETILVCLSGRGDKDVHTLQETMEGDGM